MEECIFCKIVKGEIPAYTLLEDKNYMAFLDIFPLVPGNTLVIPKSHHQFIWDVPEIGSLYEFCKKVAERFKKLGFKYVDTLTLGREVPHAHVRLLPHSLEPSKYGEEVQNLVKPKTKLDPKEAGSFVQNFKNG